MLDAEFPGQLDVVYEGVGGDLFRAALANLSPRGRLLAVGYISVRPPQPRLVQAACRSFTGCTSFAAAQGTRPKVPSCSPGCTRGAMHLTRQGARLPCTAWQLSQTEARCVPVQEYPHVAKGSGEGASAPPPAEVVGWELPSMRDLFWKQQKLQRGGQTVYGNVWAGVRTLLRAHLQ